MFNISIQKTLTFIFIVILIEFKLPLITHSYYVSMLLPLRKAINITKSKT